MNVWPFANLSMFRVRAGRSFQSRYDPAAPFRWMPTSLNVWSPTLSVHLTYLRGPRWSCVRFVLSTVISNFGTGPVGLNRSADGSAAGATPARTSRANSVRAMKCAPGGPLYDTASFRGGRPGYGTF